jgi:hypothetical protein
LYVVDFPRFAKPELPNLAGHSIAHPPVLKVRSLMPRSSMLSTLERGIGSLKSAGPLQKRRNAP